MGGTAHGHTALAIAVARGHGEVWGVGLRAQVLVFRVSAFGLRVV